MFKKVFYNTGFQIVGKAITASTTLLVTLLIARSLGPFGYGEFTKIFVFVGYFYTFSDFGLNTIYIKLANSNGQVTLLRVLVGFRLILTQILVLLAVLISLALPYNPNGGIGFSPQVKMGIAIASITIITQGLFTTANAYFQKNLRYDLSTIAAIFGSLVILAGTAVATAGQRDLLSYTAVYVLGGLTFALVAYYLIFRKSKVIILPLFLISKARQMFSLSWPVGIALVLNLVYFRIDVFILANSRPPSEVGLYGLSYQFFEAALAIPIFFSNALYPLLAQLYNSNILEFKKQVKNWLKILTILGLLLAIFLAIIAFFIPHPQIFTSRFSGSVLALQILAAGIPLFFLSALLWHVLIIYNRQKYLIVVYGAGAIFNFVANFILIPRFGYLAAAAVTVISEAIILLLLFWAAYLKGKTAKVYEVK